MNIYQALHFLEFLPAETDSHFLFSWWVPTHYQVKLQLMLRLSWAVTKTTSKP
jgi:hypothetical protein